jgi:hypothetical protein
MKHDCVARRPGNEGKKWRPARAECPRKPRLEEISRHELRRSLVMKKVLMVIMVLGLMGVVHAENRINFPIASMGADQTVSLPIAANLDLANALGLQVVGIALSPSGPVTGTLTINSITTTGSTFELTEGTNWMDFSDPASLMGMTLDWTVASVSGPLNAGFITLTSSADASGTWDLFVGHTSSDGYLDVVGGVFGNLYDGEITISESVVPEPATLSLLAFGALMAVRRRRR